MPKYRAALPQLDEGALFLTDAGLETTLLFREGIDLPHFAACELLRTDEGRDVLRSYFNRHAAAATRLGLGFVLDTATWRANPDWTARLGYDAHEFERVNRSSVLLADKVRRVWETDGSRIVIAAVVGPRADGYVISERQSAQQAADYHSWQIDLFADTEADFISALTINYSEEAIGITRAAREAGMPVAISFTVETDGRLASGESLSEAISAVDIDSGWYPAYFAVNCAHPTHLAEGMWDDDVVRRRVRGLRANASSSSHAELDNSDTLDDGNPEELGCQLGDLRRANHQLTVLGGCCGCDIRHIEAIGRSAVASGSSVDVAAD
ncbi:S-methylmethionine-dependent homocysteine/selenocysteine methylase [Marisediminicola sp. UYEF4]|uniref:homocysteine S-methyltransferase family protein n=1 Tax=Marisediminicola sp. UYEF4 TaxID=1756384 RepID=UPI0033998006